jgi:hypothetical protein
VGDGGPKGERTVDGRGHSVVDELLLFEASDLPTHTVTVSAGGVSDFDALGAVFVERGYGVNLRAASNSSAPAAAREARSGHDPYMPVHSRFQPQPPRMQSRGCSTSGRQPD